MISKRLKFIIDVFYLTSILIIIVPLVISYIDKISFSSKFNAIAISISFAFTNIGILITIINKKILKQNYSGEIRFIILLTVFYITSMLKLI